MAHSRASRGRLRQSTSSRECASLAHECLLCNREFLGISYYTKTAANSAICLQIFRCRLSTFRPVSSIYMAPTTGSYGRSQVRRLQLPQTSQEDPGLSGVSSPLRPHHRSRGCVHHDQTVSVGDRIAHIMGNHECCQMLTVYDRIGCLKNLRCRLRVEGCRVLV